MSESPREVHHTLPPAERVDYHRKAAKQLLAALRGGDAEATGRVRDALGLMPDEPRLADAQRAIAREHGHASWAGFRRDLERQPEEPMRSVARIGPGTPERYERAARALLQSLADGDERAGRRVRAHVPRLARGELVARTTLADARLVVAREYGFPTWRALVDGLREASTRRPYPESVAAAMAAIKAGDAATLERLLEREPELVYADVGAGGSLLGEIAQPEVP